MSKIRKPSKNKRKPDKLHVARTPASAAKHKKLFLENLECVPTPRLAAKLAFVARSTVYGWRNTDPEFAAAWDEAIMIGVERVERAMFDRAIKESDSNAQFIMRAHKPEIYGRHNTSSAPPANQVPLTLEETKQKLFEGDYEETEPAAPVSATDTDH